MDVRFTRSKDSRVIYAILLGLPSQGITIEALGLSSKTSPGRIAKIELLGAQQTPVWKQMEKALTISVPQSISGLPEYGVVKLISPEQLSAGLTYGIWAVNLSLAVLN